MLRPYPARRAWAVILPPHNPTVTSVGQSCRRPAHFSVLYPHLLRCADATPKPGGWWGYYYSSYHDSGNPDRPLSHELLVQETLLRMTGALEEEGGPQSRL